MKITNSNLQDLEAREDEYVTLSMKTGYRIGDMDPESLEIIGLWNEVYRKMGCKN